MDACRQRGIILPLTAIALLAFVALAALALDMGHAYLNKARLQNMLDASALSGAKVLDETKDTVQARTAAGDTFSENAGEPGNEEMANAIGAGNVTLTIQFSNTLDPFVSGSSPAQYVRVIATGFTQQNWFAQALGFPRTPVEGSAVAGPTPTLNTACNIAPMMVCGDPAAGPPWWGYEPGVVQTMKTSSTQGSNFEVGPGNFQLIRLDGSQGGADVRDAMAGDYEQCLSSGDVIETEPGDTVGPVVQGLNTRFGIYQGPFSDADRTRYRPDLVTTPSNYPALDYLYDDYTADYQAGNFTDPDGQPGRRILSVPIGDCSGTVNGQGQVPLMSENSFACFFLLDPVKQKGNESEVYGEFVDNCNAQGVAGPNPGAGPGPHLIVLHKDPDSGDS